MIDDRPRYMISVAAELVGMHPQTLRIYEAKGLLHPRRTPGGTRLYSEADLERLRLIQRLTTELRLNLAGVETVLRLEDELGRLRTRLAARHLPGSGGLLPGAREVRTGSHRAGRAGKARPGHRPRRRDPPRHAGALAAHEEQPGLDR